MRADIKEVSRPRTCVVNNRFPTSGNAIAYVGPALGPSALAPHLGMRCAKGGTAQAPEQPAPAVRIARRKWQFHSIALGTGWGPYLNLRQSGHAGELNLSGDLTFGHPRGQEVVGFTDSVFRVTTCGEYLAFDGLRIALKPRALALAIRWLEQHGVTVTREEIVLPF